MITELCAKSLPNPLFAYSPIIKMGPFIQTAGLIGINPGTNKLVLGGPGPETLQILRNLSAGMRELDIAMDDLAMARIYTTSMSRFSEVNTEWDIFFEKQRVLPARSAVGVSALPIGASIEIEFQFYVDN
jgi:2-iminobutanoate/2-iminopropanoate deaminase